MAKEFLWTAAVFQKMFLPDDLDRVQATMWVVAVSGQMPPLAAVQMTILCAGVDVAVPWVAFAAAVEAKKQRRSKTPPALFQLASQRPRPVLTIVDLQFPTGSWL